MQSGEFTPSILIVEDEADIRQLMTFVLERAGYDVVGVSSRAEALAAMSLLEFTAAVIDLMLPDGRGDQIARTLRERSPQTRIVMTSAFAHSSHVLQAAAEAGDLFLAKPFANSALVSAVAAVAAPVPAA